jgi:HAD superfamily hydrolase (TIGR01509 family)
MSIKTVGFDLFGTLVEAKADQETCVYSICTYLQECGYRFNEKDFFKNYKKVTTKNRKERHDDLREVNNCVWISDTLAQMGIVDPQPRDMKSAVATYFSNWQLNLFPEALKTLKTLRTRFKIVLVSNFTDSIFLNRTLIDLGIKTYLDHVIDSDSFGWRKPHPKIFRHFLKISNTKPKEAVFVGDELKTDIQGAKNLKIKTILLDRRQNFKKQKNTGILPDIIVNSLIECKKILLNM